MYPKKEGADTTKNAQLDINLERKEPNKEKTFLFRWPVRVSIFALISPFSRSQSI
jgi:hypothetical protein